MTQERIRPQVDLLFDPVEIDHRARREMSLVLGSTPKDSMERALYLQHVYMVNEMKTELAKSPTVTAETLTAAMDLAWRRFMPRFIRVTGPEIGYVYAKALERAEAGVVPPEYINTLAEEHARRLSGYFHESSKEAVVKSFNTLVNRRVPAKAAAERVMSAYGLPTRPMSGYVNLTNDQKFATAVPQRLLDKAKNYVRKALGERLSKFAEQEDHNLSQQAEQIAWMWNVEHGISTERAEKIWITAKDEKVCKTCGPMHGRVVKVNEQFDMPDGTKLWVPSPHPNCRCKVTFREPRRLEIVKADREHYYGEESNERDYRGRFAAKGRSGPRFKEPETETEARGKAQALLDTVVDVPVEPEVEAPRGISFATSGVSFADSPRLKPVTFNTSGGVSFGQKTGISFESKTEPKTVDMQRQGVGVEFTPKVAPISVGASVARAVSGFTELTRTKRVRPSLLHKDVAILPGPVYTVIRPHEKLEDKMDENSLIDFTHDRIWVADPGTVSKKAADVRENEINDTISSIMENPYFADTRKTGPHAGTKMMFTLSEQEVSDIVHYVANQAVSGHNTGYNFGEEHGEEHLMPVEWTYGPHSNSEVWEEEHLPYNFIAEKYFNIKPEQFEVSIATITEGHQSDRGTTIYDPDDPRGAVTTNGQYRVENTHRGETILSAGAGDSGLGRGVIFYHLTPSETSVEQLFGADVPDDDDD